MKLQRRRLLQLAAGAAVLPIIVRPARAEAFPVRPVHVIVGFPPGGVGELIARLIGRPMEERLGQPIVIEMRPGAGGNVGTEYVAKAAPDGYTLIWAGTNNAINATLYSALNFDFMRDIAMVAGVMRGALVLAVNPSLPVDSIAAFIGYTKANPGKINFASSGNGSTGHLTGELFNMMTGASIVHVPYRGEGPALTALVAGEVQAMFANMPPAIGFIRDGRLRALAVTTASRSPALPDVATIADTVPGFDIGSWFGLGAPKATPADIIAILSRATTASLDEPSVKTRLVDLGATPMPLGASDFDAFVTAETAKWAKVIGFSGAKVD